MARTSNVTRDISQREVHEFHPKLQVSARPVDTYVRPSMSNSATRLAKSLGMAVDTAGALGQIAGVQNQQAQREGHEAFLRGDETPEQVEGVKKWFTAQNVKRESFMALKGQADVVKLVPQLEEIASTSSTSQEAAARLAKLRKDMTDGAGGSTGYLQYFGPDFDAKSSRVLSQVGDRERKEAVKLLWDKQTTLTEDTLDGLVDSQLPLKPNGSSMTTQELLRDPEAYAEFTANFNSVDAAKALRGILSEVQANFKQTGLTNNSDVSKEFLKIVSRRAQQLGLPELLEFADIEDSGVKLSQVMREDIDAARNAAQVQQDRLETLTQAAQVRHRIELKETVNRDMLNAQWELQQALQMPNSSERVAAMDEAQGKIEALIESEGFQEMATFDRAGSDRLLKMQALSTSPRQAPSPALISEGLALHANGQLSAEWVTENLESLGEYKSSFVTKANSASSRMEALALTAANRQGVSNFQAGLKPHMDSMLNLIDEAEIRDYSKDREALYNQALFQALQDREQWTPEKARSLHMEVNSQLSELMLKDLTQAEKKAKLDVARSQLGKAERLGGESILTNKEVQNQRGSFSDPLLDPSEQPEDADEPSPEPVRPDLGLNFDDPKTREMLTRMLENQRRLLASDVTTEADERQEEARKAGDKKLEDRLNKLTK